MPVDANFAFETRFIFCKLREDQVHLVSHRLENSWSEARIQKGQHIWHSEVPSLSGCFPMRWYLNFLEPLSKSVRVFHLWLPIDDVSDDLVVALQVATLNDFLEASVYLLLTLPLNFYHGTHTVHHEDQVNLLISVVVLILELDVVFLQ